MEGELDDKLKLLFRLWPRHADPTLMMLSSRIKTLPSRTAADLAQSTSEKEKEGKKTQRMRNENGLSYCLCHGGVTASHAYLLPSQVFLHAPMAGEEAIKHRASRAW